MIDRPAREPDSGFTLIEVLVALVIAGVAFSVAFQALSDVSILEQQDRQLGQAMLVGENELARVGRDIPLANGTVHGTSTTGTSWQIDIADWSDPESSSFNPEALKRVEIKLVWSTGRHKHEAHLVTLRLSPRS